MTLNLLSGYYLNLDRSIDRNISVQQNLSDIGLDDYYQRFSATDIDKRLTKHISIPKYSSFSVIGNWLSHLEIMKKHSGNRNILHICEDDIYFPKSFQSYIENITLPETWDILFLDVFLPKDQNTYHQIRPYLKNFIANETISLLPLNVLGYNGSMTSYLVNPNSIEKLIQLLDLDNIQTEIAHIDNYLAYLIQKNSITAYTAFPFITSLSEHANVSTLQDSINTFMQALYRYRKSIFIDTLKRVEDVDDAFLETIRLSFDEPNVPISKETNPFQQELLFASPLQIFKVPDTAALNDGLFQDVKRWCSKPDNEDHTSYEGLRSDEDIFEDSSSYIQKLLPFVQLCITNYLKIHLSNMINVTKNMDFDIDVTPWAYHLRVGDFMKPHLHPDSFITGVYYVKTPPSTKPDEGALVMMSPDTGRSLVPHPSTVADSVTYMPDEGDLIIFPSYIPHYVNPFQAGEHTVIAFNVKLKFKGH